MSKEKIILGGGCFWCIETLFAQLKGVEKVTSGYAGGQKENPTYNEVCSGNTNHAEVIEVIYHSEIISLHTLLDVFFHVHNPTTLNQQGPDKGTQYRSIILYTTEDQKKTIEEFINDLSKIGEYKSPIVTEVKQFENFYPAEDYHQRYYDNNQAAPYCMFVIDPKRKKFMEKYRTLLKKD